MSCNNNQLVDLNGLEEKDSFIEVQENIEKTSKLIDKTIKENTEKEMEEVQKLLKN